MSISTGFKPASQVQTNSQEGLDDSALLVGNSTNTISRVFTVKSTPVRVIAYGLSEGVVEVLRIENPVSATNYTACGDIVGLPPTYEKPLRVGCHAVKLCPSQDEIVIDASGSYKVVYQGSNRLGLHVVYFEEPVTTVTNNLRGTEYCCDEPVPSPEGY